MYKLQIRSAGEWITMGWGKAPKRLKPGLRVLRSVMGHYNARIVRRPKK